MTDSVSESVGGVNLAKARRRGVSAEYLGDGANHNPLARQATASP